MHTHSMEFPQEQAGLGQVSVVFFFFSFPDVTGFFHGHDNELKGTFRERAQGVDVAGAWCQPGSPPAGRVGAFVTARTSKYGWRVLACS